MATSPTASCISHLTSVPQRLGPHPVLLSINGGHVDCDVPEFDFEYAAWTSRGYAVFCPNNRGSAPYGRGFTEKLRTLWGAFEVEHVVAAVETLVDRGWVAPTGYSRQASRMVPSPRHTSSHRPTGSPSPRRITGSMTCVPISASVTGMSATQICWALVGEPRGLRRRLQSPRRERGGNTPPRTGRWQGAAMPAQPGRTAVPEREKAGHHCETRRLSRKPRIAVPTEEIHRLEELEGWFDRHDPKID